MVGVGVSAGVGIAVDVDPPAGGGALDRRFPIFTPTTNAAKTAKIVTTRNVLRGMLIKFA